MTRIFCSNASLVSPSRAGSLLQSVLSALAVFVHAFFTVFMVFGAGFAAVVLAVTCDRMLAQFAVAFRAVAFTFAIDHESDS